MVQLFMQTLGGMVNILVREWSTLKCFMGYGVVFWGDSIPPQLEYCSGAYLGGRGHLPFSKRNKINGDE